MSAEVRIAADQRSFERVARAVAEESNGRRLRADLVHELEAAVRPAVVAVRGAVLGMRTAGLPHLGASLRAAVAASINSEIELRGDSVGVRVVARAGGMPRGFATAPKRLNQARGWAHPVFGRGSVRQVGAPGYFDDTLGRVDERARAGVADAMQHSVDRIARKA